MAITEIIWHGTATLPKRLQSLSSDDLSDRNDPEGSTLHMVDTGEEYVRYDGGWEPDRRRARAIHDAALM